MQECSSGEAGVYRECEGGSGREESLIEKERRHERKIVGQTGSERENNEA